MGINPSLPLECVKVTCYPPLFYSVSLGWRCSPKSPAPLHCFKSLERNTIRVQNPQLEPLCVRRALQQYRAGCCSSGQRQRVTPLLLPEKLHCALIWSRSEISASCNLNAIFEPSNPFQCAQSAQLCAAASQSAREHRPFQQQRQKNHLRLK